MEGGGRYRFARAAFGRAKVEPTGRFDSQAARAIAAARRLSASR
jgi:hypothetical protein